MDILVYSLLLLIAVVIFLWVSVPKNSNYFRNSWKTFVVIMIVIAAITLPFHYVPGRMMVFPKKHLSLKNTLITETTIDNLVTSYNNANFIEKIALRNDPLTRSLLEKGIIRDN